MVTQVGDPGSPWALPRVRALEKVDGAYTQVYRLCEFQESMDPRPARFCTDMEAFLELGIRINTIYSDFHVRLVR